MTNNNQKKVTLIVLDGWGHTRPWGGNAVSEASTPNFDYAWRENPHTTLKASGKYVGLPGHEMGNSEVGHLVLGSGRIVSQDISRINNAIKNGSFFENQNLLSAIKHAKKNNSKLHYIGLLSDGGVHSHIKHLFALLKVAKQEKFDDLWLHIITDGRDTPPRSAHRFLNDLEEKIQEYGRGKIATICGRYWAMDRDNNLMRTKKAYQAMVVGRGEKGENAKKAVGKYYRQGVVDEMIPPIVINQEGVIEDGDSAIFFNFRADRARQLTLFFIEPDLEYKREKFLKNFFFATMIPYQSYDVEVESHSIFTPKKVEMPLAQVLAENNIGQFHTAETEKYARVTYFFNGAREKSFDGEERVLIPSPDVETYDLKPEMSCEKVCQEVIKAQNGNKYRFILANFANPDMVGHSGNLQATIQAVEAVDEKLGRVIDNRAKNEIIIITADHGNAEEMIDRITGSPHTEHTNNPVPFILLGSDQKELARNVSLAGIAPIILKELGVEKPSEMGDVEIYK